MAEEKRRKLQINPGPLKVVPAHKRGFGKAIGSNFGRCEEKVKDGSGRCTRDGAEEVDGRWLCRQHARLAVALKRAADQADRRAKADTARIKGRRADDA